MGVRKTLAVALGAGAMFASLPAPAAHLPGFGFNAEVFTFDPTAYNLCTLATCTEFEAKYIDFSYTAEVDQTGANFDETGVAFFGTFRTELAQPPISSATTGLNLEYQMYAVFDGAGTVANNPAGGVDGTFSSFFVTIWVDPAMDTTTNVPTPGGADEAMSVTDASADDFIILAGILNEGGFHVFPGLAAGDFDVLADVTAYDPLIWGGPAFEGPIVQADINGVNTQITGVLPPPNNFTDGLITGSGNVSFQSVPEPGTLSLLGLGLLAFGVLMRRRLRGRAAAA